MKASASCMTIVGFKYLLSRGFWLVVAGTGLCTILGLLQSDISWAKPKKTFIGPVNVPAGG